MAKAKSKTSVHDYRKIVRNARIAHLTIENNGMDSDDIGKEVGLSGSSVRHILRTDERCKEILDTVHRTNIGEAIPINNELLFMCKDRTDRKLQLDAIKHHQKITRILPTHTVEKNVFTQINTDNRTVPADQVPRIMEAFELLEQADLAEEAEIIDTDGEAGEKA